MDVYMTDPSADVLFHDSTRAHLLVVSPVGPPLMPPSPSTLPVGTPNPDVVFGQDIALGKMHVAGGGGGGGGEGRGGGLEAVSAFVTDELSSSVGLYSVLATAVETGTPRPSDTNATPKSKKSKNVPQPDPTPKQQAIIDQVNFYFSNTNLATDSFLLDLVKKTPRGFVPISTLAGFKRMKMLSDSEDEILAAMELSDQVVVDMSLRAVRRKMPMRKISIAEVKSRAVIVENLAASVTPELLKQQFSSVGTVTLVRVCNPATANAKVRAVADGAVRAQSTDPFAMVEFASEEEAVKAVKAFNNKGDWRVGVRVTLASTSRRRSESAGGRNRSDSLSGRVRSDSLGGRSRADSTGGGVGSPAGWSPMRRPRARSRADSLGDWRLDEPIAEGTPSKGTPSKSTPSSSRGRSGSGAGTDEGTPDGGGGLAASLMPPVGTTARGRIEYIRGTYGFIRGTWNSETKKNRRRGAATKGLLFFEVSDVVDPINTRVGDTVEFVIGHDKRTDKPVAGKVVKVSSPKAAAASSDGTSSPSSTGTGSPAPRAPGRRRLNLQPRTVGPGNRPRSSSVVVAFEMAQGPTPDGSKGFARSRTRAMSTSS